MDLEEIRALASRDGIAADPELRELVLAYRMVEDPPPACRTRYEDLRLAPRRRLAPFLVAAAVILAAALPLLSMREAPPAVRLAALPLAPVEVVPEPAPWPEAFADYVPSDEDGIHWLDLDDARAFAGLVGRPILLFVDYPGCPLCARLESVHFRDPRLAEAAAAFVPARVHLPELPPELRGPVESWPVFHVLDPGGERRAGFGGMHSVPEYRALMEEALGALPELAPRDWGEQRRLAATLGAARADDDPGRRLAAWREVEERDPGGPFGRAAHARRTALEAAAWKTLLAARDAPVPEALRLLDAFLPRVRNTPFEADLLRVRGHIETYGAFPRLESER